MTNQIQVSNEVLTLEMCRERLLEGWELHVVCAEDPFLQNTVRGSWYLVAVEPETGRFRWLSRNEIYTGSGAEPNRPAQPSIHRTTHTKRLRPRPGFSTLKRILASLQLSRPARVTMVAQLPPGASPPKP